MAVSVTSPVLTIKLQDNVSFQAKWTGSPVGTFYVDISIDYDPNTKNPGTWTTLPLDPVITASGVADDALFELNQLGMPAVRLRYVPTSGSGTLDVWCAGKGV
jgi:hypothetical protein